MEEDLMHSLIHCSHARSLRDEAQQLFDFKTPRLHPKTRANDVLCDPQVFYQTRAKIVSVIWSISIWHSCNRWTHDQEQFNPTNSMQIITVSLAILALPCDHALAMPGHGCRPA